MSQRPSPFVSTLTNMNGDFPTIPYKPAILTESAKAAIAADIEARYQAIRAKRLGLGALPKPYWTVAP